MHVLNSKVYNMLCSVITFNPSQTLIGERHFYIWRKETEVHICLQLSLKIGQVISMEPSSDQLVWSQSPHSHLSESKHLSKPRGVFLQPFLHLNVLPQPSARCVSVKGGQLSTCVRSTWEWPFYVCTPGLCPRPPQRMFISRGWGAGVCIPSWTPRGWWLSDVLRSTALVNVRLSKAVTHTISYWPESLVLLGDLGRSWWI